MTLTQHLTHRGQDCLFSRLKNAVSVHELQTQHYTILRNGIYYYLPSFGFSFLIVSNPALSPGMGKINDEN